MNSSATFKYFIKAFSIVGLWPTTSPLKAPLYTLWTIISFIFVVFLLPISQIMNIILAQNVNDFVQQTVIASSLINVSLKCFNVYFQRSGLNELFHVLKEMDMDIVAVSHKAELDKAIKRIHRSFFTYLIFFNANWAFSVVQTYNAPPETKIWSSTYTYPFEWAHLSGVYEAGILFQSITSFFITLMGAACDTYGVILTYIFAKHIDILCIRLQALGQKNSNKGGNESLTELYNCCKTYKNILKSAGLLNQILSASLFAQFSVSGVILCLTTYQLTTVSCDFFESHKKIILNNYSCI